MPRIPACIRNAGEFGWPNILGNAMCGGGSSRVWLGIFLGYWRVAGCVLQLWKLACSRRAFVVSVGVWRLLIFFVWMSWELCFLLFSRLRSYKVGRLG